MKRFVCPLALLFSACTIQSNLSPIEIKADLEAPHIEDEILVRFDPSVRSETREAWLSSVGMREIDHHPRTGYTRIRLPDGMRVEEALFEFGAIDGVTAAEPNYLAVAMSVPDDPHLAHQWNFEMIDMEKAWVHGAGAGMVVAVLDTGVQAGGEDGITNLLTGWNFIHNNADTSDVYGHGTHVAGTIGQATGNGIGAAGIAYEASILPIKVLGDDGWGNTWAIAEGIEWAVDQGADVVNLSLGSWGGNQMEANAVSYAVSNGTVVVAAAGNEASDKLSYPAAWDDCIGVSAVNGEGVITGYSNYGGDLDIAAPGGESWRDRDGDGWYDGIYQEVWTGRSWQVQGWQGTSMATPHVAAAAALVRAQGISDAQEVREILQLSAADAGSAGFDTWYGHGILDVGAAVEEAAVRTGGVEETPEEQPEEEAEETPEFNTELNITDVEPGSDDDSLWLEWKTDVPAACDTWFHSWGQYVGDGVYRTEHRTEFWAEEGTYWARIACEDEAGNTASSDWVEISVDE